MLIDTHSHIHEPYELPIEEVLQQAHVDGVDTILCIGTSEESSRQAIDFASEHPEAFAVIGVHPHDTKDGYGEIEKLAGDFQKLVGIGEIGLDYFYTHSPKEVQIEALRAQIEVALKRDLPIVFHVREAFDDFWPIFESYK